jgi:HEAT repeats
MTDSRIISSLNKLLIISLLNTNPARIAVAAVKLLFSVLPSILSIALMLGLLKDREQALWVVRLALAVDFGLGARLAGEVDPSWQEEIVNSIYNLDISKLVKFKLLSETRSEKAVELFISAFDDYQELLNSLMWSPPDFCQQHFYYNIAHFLADTGKSSAIDYLVNATRHPSDFIRSCVSQALGKLSNSDSREKTALNSGRIDEEKLVKNDHEIKEIILDLNSDNPEIRCNAIMDLGWSQNINAIEPLIASLDDENLECRQLAASSLGNFGDPRVVLELIKNLNGESDPSRRYCALSLGKIGTMSIVSELWKIQLSSNFLYIYDSIKMIQSRYGVYAEEPTIRSENSNPLASPQVIQNFYGNVNGVAGNVQGNQINQREGKD